MAFVKTEKVTPTDQIDHVHSSPIGEATVICKRPDKLKLLLQQICPGQSTHFVSNGDFSLHDLVISLVRIHRPAEVFISTFALRETPIRQLIMAMDRGEISSIKLLLDYRAKIRTPEVFQLASMNVNKIFLTSVHAKVCIIRTATACIAIIGSMNWTTNPKIEAGVITMDAAVGNFHINWMEKVMDNAKIFK